MKFRALLFASGVIFLVAAPPGYSFEAVIRYPAPQQRNLNTVCWTGSQFIAAGDRSVVQTSPDGIVWTLRAVPGGQVPDAPSLRNSACGGGRIVLAGPRGSVLVSSDGVTWMAVGIPSDDEYSRSINELAWNGSVFRGLDFDARQNWSSPDGLVWTLMSTTARTYRISVQGSDFIAWEYPNWGAPQHFLRDSGSGWSSTAANLTQVMQDVAWSGLRYITVGEAGAAATSTDGISWTPRTTGTTADLAQLVWTGTLAVAVGTGGTIISSPNGATWNVETSGTQMDLNAVAWSGSAFVAVGDGGTILRSSNGTLWTPVDAAAPPLDVTGVAWTGNSAVAVGSRNGTLISADGISWTRTAATAGPSGPYVRMASGAGKLVAADARAMWTAPSDASSWTNVTQVGEAQVGTQGNSVLWNGQSFVALTRERDNGNPDKIMYYSTRSTNALNWSALTPVLWTYDGLPLFDPPVNDLLYTGSLYLSGGKQSIDAVTWTDASVPVAPFLFQTEQGIVAVKTFEGEIYVSADGISWTVSVPPDPNIPAITSAVWTGYRVLANGGTLEGGPGRPWTRLPDVGGVSMAWTGTRVLVATGDTIFSIENPDASFPPTWRLWRKNHFTSAELNDPAVSGALADADRDGLANVVEFMAASSPVSGAHDPVLTVHPPAAGAGARFQWTQDTGRTGVQARAEVSSDLDVWDNAAITPLDGAAGGFRTMQASAPAGLTKVYFRLKVTLTE